MPLKGNYLIFAMVLVVALSSFGGVWAHEQNHVFINERVGISSHIDFVSYFPAIATVRDTPQLKDLSNFELAQSFNESVNYNTMPWFVGIMGLMVLGFIYLGEKVGDKE